MRWIGGGSWVDRATVRGLVALVGPVVAVVGPVACEPSPSAACTHHWTAGADGAWDDASGWDTGTVPGPDSVACFDIGHGATVPPGEPVVVAGTRGGRLEVPAGASLELTGDRPSDLEALDLAGSLRAGDLAVGTLGWTSGSIGGVGAGATLEVVTAARTSGDLELTDGMVISGLAGSRLAGTGTVHLSDGGDVAPGTVAPSVAVSVSGRR